MTDSKGQTGGKQRIGIDLGGTKIEIVAFDAYDHIAHRRRVATPRGDYAATLDLICRLVTEAEDQLGERATVGVGTPGALSPASGLLRNSNSVCLNGKPLDRDLSVRLQRPVRIANDANCFALSEAIDGAAAAAATVFGVIVGTGTGAGFVVHGQALQGCNAIAGEWGHNPLPWPRDDERPGPKCYCGRSGCIETFLSGPGLAQDYRAAGGEDVAARTVVERAEMGDRIAVRALSDYVDRMARALASVINILDPDVIVLGGGLSNVNRLYEAVPQRWQRYVFSDVVATRLVPAKHGDASGVRGAAWLWPKR